MKKSLLIFYVFFAISCNRNGNVEEIKIKNSTFKKKENIIIDTISETKSDRENIQNIYISNKSKIVKSKFDLELLFGIWTYDPEGPHADFELTRKSFFVVDYDGNGHMPYIINQDTIKVFYSDYISVGIIKNATKDTLKIDWDENGTTNYVKWKG